MPYPRDLLASRSIIEPGKYALIAPEGLVNNVVPGFSKARISIVASPKYGASFVEYLVELQPGGHAEEFGGDGIESFVYVTDGELTVTISGVEHRLQSGGYAYAPTHEKLSFTNHGATANHLVLYKQRYQPLAGVSPWVVIGNVHAMTPRIYDEMANVTILDLLPTDLAFDMNFHILSFQPGGCHPFVETHVQEHGAYLLSGEGVYNLDNQWMPVKKGDFIWFGPYVPQACYGVGREPLTYVYSKDCNRDVEL